MTETPAAALSRRRLARRRGLAGKVTVYMVLSVGGIFMAMPFYWMVASSVKTSNEALAFPPTWVPGVNRPETWDDLGAVQRVGITLGQVFSPDYWIHQLRWDNYPRAWLLQTSDRGPAETTFTRYFYNSVVVSLVATVGSLVTSVLAAYALASMTFLGAGFYFFLILGTLYIPGQILLIPNYIFLDWLGSSVSSAMGRNTYFCLIIPWLASVFSIFLLRQAFMTLPKDLHDAARIDGAGRLRHLFLIVLPLSKPTLITAGLFNFLGTWNMLLWPLIMAPEPKYRTVMVGLSLFRTEANDKFDLLMAASTFSILPIVILFFFLQRFFIAGIARTGLK